MSDFCCVNPELQRLAFKIADEAAQVDLESNCECHMRDGVLWIDLDAPGEGVEHFIADALRYIELRGADFPTLMVRAGTLARFEVSA